MIFPIFTCGDVDRLIFNGTAMSHADATRYVALALVCLMLGMTASIGQIGSGNGELDEVPEKSMTHVNTNFPGFTPGSIFSDASISVSRGTACYVRHNGTLACWGFNDAGQLGDGGPWGNIENSSDTPVDVVNVENMTFREVAVGMYAACAITTTDELYCWGGGQNGELGRPVCENQGYEWYPCRNAQGKLAQKVNFPQSPNASVRTIAGTGDSAHFCAIIDDGDVSCWGANSFGQLGTGAYCADDVARPNPATGDLCNVRNGVTRPQETGMPDNMSAISISVGSGHSCAVLENNSVYCWGSSAAGEMGQGERYRTFTADQYVHSDTNPPNVLNLTDASIFPSAGKGYLVGADGGENEHTHNIAWTGKNGNQLTGLTTNVNDHNVDSGSSVILAVQLDPIHVPMPGGRGAGAIDSGGTGHTAVLDDGNVAYWGFGDPNTGAPGWNTTPALSPYLGPDLNRSVVSFTQSPSHGCAILDNFEAWCGGSNSQGQLGLGFVSDFENISKVHGNHEFVAVAAGAYFSNDDSRWNSTYWGVASQATCGINITGSVFCWGSDNGGTLGNGGFGSSTRPETPIYVEPGTDGTAWVSDRDPDDDGTLAMLDALPWGCPSGYFVVDGGCTGYTSPGYHSPEYSEENLECAPGEFQPLAGQGSCTEAAPGHYVAGSAATSQDACEPGYYQPESGQSSCFGADPGHETNVEATAQMMCGTGYYQPLANQSNCLAADPGNYVDGMGSTAQAECGPGTYSANLAASSCSLAFAGHHAPGYGSESQTLCEPGAYADTLGLAECKLADPGNFVGGSGSSSQTSCTMPQYQPMQGQSECLDSSPGYYVDTDGAVSQEICPPGTFQPANGATSCMDASPGHHAPSEGTGVEVPCAVGHYQPDYGAVICTSAEPGSYVEEEGSSSQAECPEGYYQPDAGSSSCLEAEPGNYADGIGSEVQRECVPGTFQPLAGQDSCMTAEAGHSAEGPAATAETVCSPGTYQPEAGRATCIETTAGAFAAGEGSLDFEYCGVGTYQPSTGQSECLEADPGHIVSLIGSLNQYPCEPGTYQPEAGQTGCIDAQKGHYVESEGSPSQTPCEPGSYQPLAKATYCIDAGVNNHVPESGAFFQQPCPSGETQPQKGQSSCIAEAADDSGGSIPGFAFMSALVAISMAAGISRRR